MPRAAGREAGRAEFTPPLLVSDLCYSQWKTVPEKALAISGADRFTRRGGTCRLHAIFMNRSRIIWGYQEELSSTAGHGECSVGVNRNKKQSRHPAHHPTQRIPWRLHETRSRLMKVEPKSAAQTVYSVPNTLRTFSRNGARYPNRKNLARPDLTHYHHGL